MPICLFLFFKQKTAYEMRISDWSSDVCSSDLKGALDRSKQRSWKNSSRPSTFQQKSTPLPRSHGSSLRLSAHSMTICSLHIARCRPEKPGNVRLTLPLRSEEHTSELQSLLRISYAVFCLNKKIRIHQPQTHS